LTVRTLLGRDRTVEWSTAVAVLGIGFRPDRPKWSGATKAELTASVLEMPAKPTRVWRAIACMQALLRPSIALALILSVTGSLLAFDQFFLLTYGGPGSSTVTVVYAIYREAFLKQNLGTAAALSIVLLLALLVLNVAQFRGLRRGSGI